MRKIRILVLAFVVLAAILVTASVAGADNGATSTPFKFTAFGVSCSGVHILKAAPNPVHKESETCTDTVGYYPPGTYSLGSGGPYSGWWSDYHLFVLHESVPVVATSGMLVVTDNGDGTFAWDAVSYYP
jgi:hypothetical protein